MGSTEKNTTNNHSSYIGYRRGEDLGGTHRRLERLAGEVGVKSNPTQSKCNGCEWYDGEGYPDMGCCVFIDGDGYGDKKKAKQAERFLKGEDTWCDAQSPRPGTCHHCGEESRELSDNDYCPRCEDEYQDERITWIS